MSATNSSRATILGLNVQNFQGIQVALLEHLPGSGLVRVTGKNGAGKSSILRAIEGALGGRARVHERAVNDQAEDGKAVVDVELSNGYRITKRHTEANPKGYLTVVGPDGGKHGQGKLDEMTGPLSFDPLAFYSLKPDRQRDILLSIGRDPELATKLSALKAEVAALYEERRPYNSEIQRIQRMEEPGGERPDPVDVSVESSRLRDLRAAERAHQDLVRAAAGAESAVESARVARDRAEARVVDLEAKLAEAREDAKAAAVRLTEAENDMEAAVASAAESVDPSDEIQAVMARIGEAEAVGRALEPWREWDRAQARVEEVKKEAEALTVKIEAARARERQLIAEAGIPVDGLSFDESGEPLLNGRPLVLASGGERIRMAVAVALAVDPELGVCLVDEANDLDPEALDELHTLAVEHGFQVWACRIGLEGPGDVTVENGRARSAITEEAP